jgi:squalene-hopene/tetraprenyl-beta-curcumene cyclase
MLASNNRRFIVALCLGAIVQFSACSRQSKASSKTWDPKLAAAYLDQRETSWMKWPAAARDHGTFCVSCHTVVPYVIARPALRSALAEQDPSDDEQRILENVTERVRLWNQVAPYYTDEGYGNRKEKPAESRGTEAVLNALILANHDAQSGRLSDATEMAFRNMWASQAATGDEKGSWSWLQFGMEPFEAPDSRYYGASLAAFAVGVAPTNYQSRPEIQSNLRALHDYLNGQYGMQSTMNHVVLLWASTKLHSLIDGDRRASIIQEIETSEQADGGWQLSALAWPREGRLHSFVRTHLRSDWTRQDLDSDGYATGLIAYVLEQVGMTPQEPVLKRALSWLAENQNSEDGSWPSLSLTKRRDPSSMTGHFMRDAATAYAALALIDANSVRDRDTQSGSRAEALKPSQLQ